MKALELAGLGWLAWKFLGKDKGPKGSGPLWKREGYRSREEWRAAHLQRQRAKSRIKELDLTQPARSTSGATRREDEPDTLEGVLKRARTVKES